MSKRILTRIQQKHELEADWNEAKGFFPYEGELIVYDADTQHPYPRFKVGDGIKNVIDLPFSDAEYCHLDDLDGVSANLTGHTTNTTIHITSTERTNWNAARTHSQAAHAPSNAQPNQNAFSNVKVGSTTVAADTTTDTIELVGSNVTLTPDATNDKITIGITKTNVTTALGYTPPTTDTNTTYTFATGSSNGTISVTPSGGTAQSVAVKGLGSAAYTASTAYATAAQGTKADSALPKAGGNISGHVYLTGANTSSSTGSTSQLVFGTSSNNHVVLSSNNNALVINPTISTTTNQIVLYLDSPSQFPCGISTSSHIYENGTALANKYAPLYQYKTADLTANSSALTTGTLYFVYE